MESKLERALRQVKSVDEDDWMIWFRRQAERPETGSPFCEKSFWFSPQGKEILANEDPNDLLSFLGVNDE